MMKLTHFVFASMALLGAASLYAAEARLTFEGRYEYRTDAESLEMLGEQVCFYPTEPSSQNVPRPAGDRRLLWFCFANSKQAAHMLGFALGVRPNGCGVTGSAGIVVSHYKRYRGEGDDNDLATLGAVLKKSEPGLLPCSR